MDDKKHLTASKAQLSWINHALRLSNDLINAQAKLAALGKGLTDSELKRELWMNETTQYILIRINKPIELPPSALIVGRYLIAWSDLCINRRQSSEPAFFRDCYQLRVQLESDLIQLKENKT